MTVPKILLKLMNSILHLFAMSEALPIKEVKHSTIGSSEYFSNRNWEFLKDPWLVL